MHMKCRCYYCRVININKYIKFLLLMFIVTPTELECGLNFKCLQFGINMIRLFLCFYSLLLVYFIANAIIFNQLLKTVPILYYVMIISKITY